MPYLQFNNQYMQLNDQYLTAYLPVIIPACLSDENTIAWYDYTDLSTLTLSIDSSVSSWRDKYESGRDITQSTVSNNPKWTSNGIIFDGINDNLISGAWTLVQPEMIYIVVKQITSSIGDGIFDGRTSASGLLEQNVSPLIDAWAGGDYPPNDNLPLNTWAVVRVLFNGASSKLVVNDTTPVTGNFGSNNMGGFCLGRRPGVAKYSNIGVKEIIIRNTVDTTQNESEIYTYLRNKYFQ